MTQAQLWDDPPFPRYRRTDPAQSVSAAVIASERLPSRRARILEALSDRPMTDDEICEYLEEAPRWWPSIKTARSALKHDGLVVASGVVWHGQMMWSLRPEIETIHVGSEVV